MILTGGSTDAERCGALLLRENFELNAKDRAYINAIIHSENSSPTSKQMKSPLLPYSPGGVSRKASEGGSKAESINFENITGSHLIQVFLLNANSPGFSVDHFATFMGLKKLKKSEQEDILYFSNDSKLKLQKIVNKLQREGLQKKEESMRTLTGFLQTFSEYSPNSQKFYGASEKEQSFLEARGSTGGVEGSSVGGEGSSGGGGL